MSEPDATKPDAPKPEARKPAPKASTPPQPPAPRAPSWAAAVVFFIVVGVVAIVVAAQPTRGGDRDRDPLELVDQRELVAVVTAVSGVIRAEGETAEDEALRRLEALRPQSPGAADLRDACVSTYRGTHDAQRAMAQVRALLPPDGGSPTPGDEARMRELLDRSQRLVSEARESHLRCVGLYEQAAARVGVTPARRPEGARR